MCVWPFARIVTGLRKACSFSAMIFNQLSIKVCDEVLRTKEGIRCTLLPLCRICVALSYLYCARRNFILCPFTVLYARPPRLFVQRLIRNGATAAQTHRGQVARSPALSQTPKDVRPHYPSRVPTANAVHARRQPALFLRYLLLVFVYLAAHAIVYDMCPLTPEQQYRSSASAVEEETRHQL